MDPNVNKYSFVLATHVYATGPPFFLEEYLIKHHVKKLLFIGLPFSYAKDRRPFFHYYESGKLVEERYGRELNTPDVFLYVRDVFLVNYWILAKGRFDYFIGVDNLNTFSGLVSRFFGRVKKVVFYTIDFVPQRFANSVLNNFYHTLEKLAVYKSDCVWNLSARMVAEREKRGYSHKHRSKQITVPIGSKIENGFQILKSKFRHKIVFMGHLRAGQGLEMLLSAFPLVLKKLPDASLLIVGGGQLEDALHNIVKQLKIQKHVVITGFVQKFSDVQKLLSQAAIAVAPYVDDENNFTRFTDPGKVKDYLALSLPVVVTEVPEVSREIQSRKAGLAIAYDRNALAGAICKLLINGKLLLKFRKNAFNMAKDYEWEHVFDHAFSQTL